MKSQTFYNTSAVLFASIGFVHLLRAVNKWDVMLGDWLAPIWISWLAVFVAGYLAYCGFKLGQK